ncbi:YibE/F family protein [Demequina sp. B12]|uniref:YibE/F family protein n=1 Tax=Demequina sp. B12 TaxID=2992757 RepID=UPI00237BC563|nr:YibE/F family protein [Demequina sp. B12]MDE0572871.1 YibE/F family protein [Demequina sp. B12]
MGAGHSHVLEDRPRASERTTTVLTIAVGIVVFLTMAGAVAVWPSDWSFLRSVPTTYEGASWVDVTVDSVDDATGVAQVTIDEDPESGLHELMPLELATFSYSEGDSIRVLMVDDGTLIFGDFNRGPPILVLLVLYVVLVLAIAWWRGLGALLGLVAAFGVVIFFTVPALFEGANPVVVGLVTGSGALFVLLYLAHGANARTTTAYLGTLAGLVITTLLAAWAVEASHLTGFWSEEGTHLELAGRTVDLQALVLCGIIIAGLGVLNDVTVTQASAVWELRAARPDLSAWSLFARGMRIGRDHIASTVYTIAFAYVGAALPTIMLVSLYDQSIGMSLTSAEIAEEVVRTLVGSIGLVLAVPLTTGIGALVVGHRGALEGENTAVSESATIEE